MRDTAQSRPGSVLILTATMITILAVGIVMSATWGQFEIPAHEVISTFGRKFGLLPASHLGTMQYRIDATLWGIRFPRIAMGLFVGAALGIGGALAQSIFANPLAEPSVIGISAGASVGAAISIVFGINCLGLLTTPIFAFIFGFIATIVVWALSLMAPEARAITMLLIGIAINAICGAITAFLFVIAPTQARDAVTFWTLGSFNAANWQSVVITGLITVAAIALALPLAHRLDILALGERAATHLGINIKRLHIIVILLISVLTAGSVAFVGMISFVGLVIPHFVRITIGPSHRYLLPLSMLGGSALITVADMLARNLIPYADLPIGMITALIGGPTFLLMLRSALKGKRL